MAVSMKIAVAAIERADSRATPQMPWPEVQPPPSRAPKPTSRPAAMMTVQLAGNCGVGIAMTDQPASQRCQDEPGDKGDAPALVGAAGIEQAAEDAADAGDPAGQQHQQDGGKADQRAADRGR